MQVELSSQLPPSPVSRSVRWYRTVSTHHHPPSQSHYQAPSNAKDADPLASNKALFASTHNQETRHSRGEACARSSLHQKAVNSADVSDEAPGALCRDRTEPCPIPKFSHSQPLHIGPTSKFPVPLLVPSLHITSLQSPPTSPNALSSDATEIFGPNVPVKNDTSLSVASPVFPPPSPDCLKRRRASTTAMYEYQHNANTNFNDDNTMKRSKSSSTAICHPKKRKLSASFIKSIENDILYPIYTPRASSCSSESSGASNYSSSASSSQEDSYKPRPERRHHCKLCSASFARGHDLRRHERTHSNIRDHKCSVCGRDFSRRDALQRHIAVCDGQRKVGKKNTTAAKSVSAGPVLRKEGGTK